jgi:hypothetical protein
MQMREGGMSEMRRSQADLDAEVVRIVKERGGATSIEVGRALGKPWPNCVDYARPALQRGVAAGLLVREATRRHPKHRPNVVYRPTPPQGG